MKGDTNLVSKCLISFIELGKGARSLKETYEGEGLFEWSTPSAPSL